MGPTQLVVRGRITRGCQAGTKYCFGGCTSLSSTRACSVLSGRHPVRGTTIVSCQPPAKDGLAAIVALRRDRGGQRGLLPRQGKGPHLAHMRQVFCFVRVACRRPSLLWRRDLHLGWVQTGVYSRTSPRPRGNNQSARGVVFRFVAHLFTWGGRAAARQIMSTAERMR